MSDTTPTPERQPTPAPVPFVPAVPPQIVVPQKDTGVAYVLWFFFGVFGVHKFYLGRPGWGVAYLLTLGFVGIGPLVDLFTMPSQVRTRNAELRNEAVTGR